jgi:hypothetical protein
LEPFTAEEQKFAEVEINAFREAPTDGKVPEIVKQIHAEIGRIAHEAKILAEQNATHEPEGSDIFSEVFTPKSDDNDDNEIQLF